MSGTSLDGVDLALADYSLKDGTWNCDFIYASTIAYDSYWVDRLANGHLLNAAGLEQLDKDYTAFLGGVIRDFCNNHTDQKIFLVASHGHTILHQPEKGFTLQIGNRPELRGLIGLPVVCDFRVQDVKLGGQGAPLVPMGDSLLFGRYQSCLNLGGFANCSFQRNNNRIAYDICPVNIVMNPLSGRLGMDYDTGGAAAASGTIIPELLDRLNALGFYRLPPPKSLGKEWVVRYIDPILEQFSHHSPQDLLRTYVEHVAMQLAAQLPEGPCLVTGGGAHNRFLMKRISDLSRATIKIPDPWLVDNKEALIFGLLGILKWRGEVNCLSSVTGASQDHSSGMVFR